MIFQNVKLLFHFTFIVAFYSFHISFLCPVVPLLQYFSAIRSAAAGLLSSFSILLVFPLIANATAIYNWILPACSGSSCLSRLAACVSMCICVT